MRKYYFSSKAGEHRRGGLYCIVLLLYTVFLRKYCTAFYCISVGLYLLYMQYTIWLKWSCNMFIMKPNLKGQCQEMLKHWQQVNIFQSIKNSSYDYSITMVWKQSFPEEHVVCCTLVDKKNNTTLKTNSSMNIY